MGRVRTKTVKKAARVIIEKYYTRLGLLELCIHSSRICIRRLCIGSCPNVGSDFHSNKRVTAEIAVIESKRLRNKIAGSVE